MGRPVVHFEIMSREPGRLRSYYADLFEWQADADNPLDYGLVPREDNLTACGIGIGGGIGRCPDSHPGHVTFYVEVPDVEQALQRAETLGGKRLMGPETILDGVELGHFSDPDGNVIGLLKGRAADARP